MSTHLVLYVVDSFLSCVPPWLIYFPLFFFLFSKFIPGVLQKRFLPLLKNFASSKHLCCNTSTGVSVLWFVSSRPFSYELKGPGYLKDPKISGLYSAASGSFGTPVLHGVLHCWCLNEIFCLCVILTDSLIVPYLLLWYRINSHLMSYRQTRLQMR